MASKKSQILLGTAFTACSGLLEFLLADGSSPILENSPLNLKGVSQDLTTGLGSMFFGKIFTDQLDKNNLRRITTNNDLIELTGNSIARVLNNSLEKVENKEERLLLSKIIDTVPTKWRAWAHELFHKENLLEVFLQDMKPENTIMDISLWEMLILDLEIHGKKIKQKAGKQVLKPKTRKLLAKLLDKHFYTSVKYLITFDSKNYKSAYSSLKLLLLERLFHQGEQVLRQLNVPVSELYDYQKIVHLEIVGLLESIKKSIDDDNISKTERNELQESLKDLGPSLVEIQNQVASSMNQLSSQIESLQNDIRNLTINSPKEDSSQAQDERAVLYRNKIPRPYRVGLEAYKESDSAFFMGRNADIRMVTDKLLKGQRFLNLVGPSGIGKSSFLQAGIIPELKKPKNDWAVIMIRPALHPFSALLNSISESDLFDVGVHSLQPNKVVLDHFMQHPEKLAEELSKCLDHHNSSSKLLLIVDQFEELLLPMDSQKEQDQSEALQFLEFLKVFVSDQFPRHVLITSIRAASSEQMWQKPWSSLTSLMNDKGFSLHELNENDLNQILRVPLIDNNLPFEQELIDSLLDSFKRVELKNNNFIPLPLLSLAMSKVAERWVKKCTEAKKITKFSKDLFNPDELSDLIGDSSYYLKLISKESLHKLFLVLVSVDEKREAIRKIADFSEIEDDREIANIVRSMINERLIISKYPGKFEFVHDVLFRAWNQLGKWIEEYRDDLYELSDLRSSATYWENHRRSDRPNSNLLNKERLIRCDKTLTKLRVDLSHENEKVLENYINISKKEVIKEMVLEGDIMGVANFIEGSENIDISRTEIDERVFEKYYLSIFPSEIEGFRQNLQDPLAYFREEDLNKRIGGEGKGFTLAHYAAVSGNINVLQRFQDLGADLFSDDWTSDKGTPPWFAAIYGNQMETLKWFINEAKSIKKVEYLNKVLNFQNEDGLSPLIWATYLNNAEMATKLLLEGARPDLSTDTGSSALHFAVINGNASLVNLLLQSGANLNLKDNFRRNAFHLVIRNNQKAIDTLQVLCDVRKDTMERPELMSSYPANDPINEAEEDGFAPLHLTVFSGSSELLSMLVQNGAQIDVRVKKEDSSDPTPLMLSCRRGLTNLVRKLLELGADPTLMDSQGNTALHYALEGNGDHILEIIELLIEKGGSISTPNEEGLRPLSWAIEIGNHTILEDLIEVKDLTDKLSQEELDGMLYSAVKSHAGTIAKKLIKLGASSGQFLRIVKKRDSNRYETRLPSKKKFKELVATSLKSSVDWHMRPILPDHWKTLKMNDAVELLTDLYADLPIEYLTGVDGFSSVRSRTLAFFPSAKIFEALAYDEDKNALGGLIFVRDENGENTFINGSNVPLYHLRDKSQLQISSNKDFIKEFVALLTNGKNSQFGIFSYIATKEELVQTGLNKKEIKEIEKWLKPMFTLNSDDHSSLFQAPIFYNRGLYIAKISFDGIVRLLDDDAIVTNLDMGIEYFSQGLRRMNVVRVEGDTKFKDISAERTEELLNPNVISESQEFLPLWCQKVGANFVRLSGEKLRKRIKKELKSASNETLIEIPYQIAGEWKRCELEEAVAKLESLASIFPVNEEIEIKGIDALHKLPLDLFNGYDFFEAIVNVPNNQKGKIVFFSDDKDEVILLDGTPQVFLNFLNENLSKQLSTPEEVKLYLSLYIHHQQWDGTVMRIINEVAELRIDDKSNLNLLNELVKPMKIVFDNGRWLITVIIHFRNYISKCHFEVNSNGDVLLINEIPLVKINTFVDLFHEGVLLIKQ